MSIESASTVSLPIMREATTSQQIIKKWTDASGYLSMDTESTDSLSHGINQTLCSVKG
ncbi:hypothetical protein JCM19239_4280 [Vibrio variabilis]|uniref:Uncharacterized protein n=1 Tax=Vibrio variabilis TaxID=990271 RepID=A0ABQ0JAJ7_9VIBR|nr:hypothetical protein JCM19239_4280 [Vibrio variabilis]